MHADNERLVHRGYELFGKADVGPEWNQLFTEDAVWHTPGFAFEPEYKGVEAILSYYVRLYEVSGGTIKVVPEHFMSDEHLVHVTQRITGQRDGKAMDTHEVLVFEIVGGKVARVTEFVSEPESLRNFWT